MAKLQTAYAPKLRNSWQALSNYWKSSWLHKAFLVVVCLAILAITGMYSIARWYMYTQRNQPTVQGVSFVADYASSLGVDPHKTYTALLDNVGVRNFRLVSYWSDIEHTKGHYDFSELDWEFAQAESHHAHILLSVGLRQPRWPECHVPGWVDTSKPESTWYPQLQNYMTAVVNRYKNSPALASYQVENEYFLKVFGTCNDYDRQRLVNEYNLVKKLDPVHPIVITRSNNALGTPLYAPTPDQFGVSVYKRVWDAAITHRYFEYPIPAWYYSFLAGVQKITTGRPMILHELQAEPWAPNGKTIPQISLDEQNKSLDAQRLQGRFKYAKATGIPTVYYWGAEYWYYRQQVLHNPDLIYIAQKEFKQ